MQAELQHCRWAMLGVAGILLPDALTHAGALNVPLWCAPAAPPLCSLPRACCNAAAPRTPALGFHAPSRCAPPAVVISSRDRAASPQIRRRTARLRTASHALTGLVLARLRRTEVGALKFGVADTTTLFLVQMVLFSFAEHKRLYDIKNPGSQGAPGSFAGLEAALGGSGEVGYPGKIFDPLNLAKDPKEFAELKVKEIKNGRLAMLAMLGFAGQAYSTGEGPTANLVAHINDPFHTTVATKCVPTSPCVSARHAAALTHASPPRLRSAVALPHILGF